MVYGFQMIEYPRKMFVPGRDIVMFPSQFLLGTKGCLTVYLLFQCVLQVYIMKLRI
jgi:hypothetical protein